MTVSVDVVLPNSHNVGAFLGARINNGGCSGTAKATGVFLWINIAGHWSVTKDIGMLINRTWQSIKLLLRHVQRHFFINF